MKEFEVPRCDVHALVCTNERDNGRDSCGPLGGKECFAKLKERLKGSGMAGTRWVTRTGCLGFCNPSGAVVKIQRGADAQWFTAVRPEDVDALWEEIKR